MARRLRCVNCTPYITTITITITITTIITMAMKTCTSTSQPYLGESGGAAGVRDDSQISGGFHMDLYVCKRVVSEIMLISRSRSSHKWR